MSNDKLIYKLALSFIPNIGCIHAKNLVSYCGGIEKVFSIKKKEILKIPGIGEKKAEDIVNNNALKIAETELKKLENKDISLLFYLDEEYPSRLKNYPDSPLLLYKKGNANINPDRTVAIIGTRNADAYGTTQCEKLIEELTPYHCTIISGLAYGIDTCAHRKSVELDVPNIGILGTGIDSIYPSTNNKLAEAVIKNGALLSEFQLGTKPDRENFPQRNRIIAAMSDVIVVIQSAIKGGSIITAEYANNYNKDVFAIPGKVTDEMSMGCNHLIKTHKAHLCTSAKDIAYIMRWDQRSAPKQMELYPDLNDKEESLFKLIKDKKEIGMESLLYISTFSISELSSLLLNLEFKGLVKSLPGKKYILA